MHVTALAAPALAPGHLRSWSLAALCVAAGGAAFATHWIADDLVRFGYALVLCAAYFGAALALHRAADARWPLAFAFGTLALVELLNNSIPGFVASNVLHARPI